MQAHQITPPGQSLGFFPTPLVALNKLSNRLNGPRLLMKRDDQTGLASGGNKTRKLEFLVREALALGCDTLVTGGSAQSNHCRQTAAAAACCGLQCHLALGGSPPGTSEGNLLLDTLLGAHVHWTGELRKGEKIPEIATSLTKNGAKPYIIPYGGSNHIGALGFVEAVAELAEQLDLLNTKLDSIVFASSSGGTQAGLVVGRHLYGQDFSLVGIGIDKDEAGDGPFAEHVLHLAQQTANHLQLGVDIAAREIIVRDEFVGKGYGVVGELEQRAIRLVARTEGILLDPVYTGRAMGGLITMIENNEFSKDETVLFWHTGGLPAIFSYAEELQ